MAENISKIIQAFGLDPAAHAADAFGSGLIHRTYLVRKNGIPSYILQQVNHIVFTRPYDISHNLHIMGSFLKTHAPDYPFTFPVSSKEDDDYVVADGQYFRMFRFIAGTHTIDTCLQPEQAYEAAFQFGRFTSVLRDLRTDMLRITIPGFHDLSYRYEEFIKALEQGNKERLAVSIKTAQWLTGHKEIAEQYKKINRENLFQNVSPTMIPRSAMYCLTGKIRGFASLTWIR